MKIKQGKNARATRPGIIVYIILGGIVSLYAKVFKKQQLHRSYTSIKPPFILIGNHSSFFDFIYAIRAFYPRRINFVVARKYFHICGLRQIMKISHSIPKSLFQNDLSAIRAMFDILKQGGIVGIYPEGQIAAHGISIQNSEAIAKFVKKAGVPLVSILTGGGYFCNPPWTKLQRRGAVKSSISIALTAAQVENLGVNEISSVIKQNIFMNNFQWQRANNAKYSGKNLAQGLENLLYICPCCKNEFTISTKGDYVFCENCSASARFCEDGHLLWQDKNYFNHIGQWYLWQIEIENNNIMQSENFSVSEPVILAMLKLSGCGIEPVGQGVFTADKKNYTYKGTLHGENVTLTFSSALRAMPYDTGSNFQIYDKNLLYEFRPANPKFCVKIANICECLFNIAST